MYHPHDTHTGSCPTLQEHVSINTATVLMRLLGNGTRYPVHGVQLPSSAEGFLELCDHVAVHFFLIEVTGPCGEECLGGQSIRRNTDQETADQAINEPNQRLKVTGKKEI